MVTINTGDVEITVEPRIAVIGVGGAGCNVVGRFTDDLLPVDVIAINTDREALQNTHADYKILICKDVTKGVGTGGDAALGKKCAKIHSDEIRDALRGHDIAVIVAGMGGGTGSGAAAIVAEIAQGLNIITMAIAIRPLSIEGRGTAAGDGLRSLRSVCPGTIAVENNLIFEKFSNITVTEAFDAVNESIENYVMRKVDMIAETFAQGIKKILPSEEKVGDRNTSSVPAGMFV
ncbi:MAG TPA: cell division protein FtsZ [Candidatus Methanomethylophilaceae archaeon]|nr:cell division protein FtsZ [Candidatus Methanomethylophilaceae archaeon]